MNPQIMVSEEGYMKNIEWKRWQYGWGESLNIKGLPTITVGKSDVKGEEFYYRFGDVRSKPMFLTLDDAKARVLVRVESILREALDTLTDPKQPT